MSIVAFFRSATTTTKQNYIALSLSLQVGVGHYWQALGKPTCSKQCGGGREGNLQGTNVPSRGEQCSYHTDMRDKCRPE